MRAVKYVYLAGALLFPALLYAGQIYGSIVSEGRGVAKQEIEINCKGAITRGTTAPNGSYRINVPQNGECTLTLSGYAGRPSAVIFSTPGPAAYNFELVAHDGTYELRRR